MFQFSGTFANQSRGLTSPHLRLSRPFQIAKIPIICSKESGCTFKLAFDWIHHTHLHSQTAPLLALTTPIVLAAPSRRSSRKSQATPKALPNDSDASHTTDRLQRLSNNSSDAVKALIEKRSQRKNKNPSTTSIEPQTSISPTPKTTRSKTVVASSPPRAALPPQTVSIPQDAFPPAPQRKSTVNVRFWMPFKVNYGEEIYVVGSSPELGSWILSSGIPLRWSDGDMWNGSVDIPAGSVVEYKYVVVGHGGHAVMWQNGNNSVLALQHSDDAIDVYDNWTCSPGAQVVSPGAAPVTRENRLLAWANEIEAQVSTQRQELRRVRMELVAAQEEAKVAREESRRLKIELMESESQRIAAVSNLKKADMTNQLLQAKLAETSMSLKEALETALTILEKSSKTKRSSSSTTTGGGSSSSTVVTSNKNTTSGSLERSPVNGIGAVGITTATAAVAKIVSEKAVSEKAVNGNPASVSMDATVKQPTPVPTTAKATLSSVNATAHASTTKEV